MKKITVFFTGAILLSGLILVSTAFKSLPPGQSANGQGALLNPWFNGQVQHFSFHANKDANGNVTGSWESKSPGQELRTHGTINCLTILADGKTAYMTGVVTHRVGEGLPGAYEIGSPVWFKVTDNGEGNNSAADRFSDYYNVGNCINRNPAMYEIISGNIQVKP